MKAMISIMLALGIVGVAAAYDLGNQAPVKPIVTYPENVPNPERQGGDTIETAFLIPNIPFHDTGTTTGFNNDYDEVCPFSGSVSPDVVYAVTPATDVWGTFDLCGSSYDTKIYIYDQDLHVVACNDDFYLYGPPIPCGLYVSKLEWVPLTGQELYYVVVDGYMGQHGDYILGITYNYEPCILECAPGGFAEGEPPLHDGYVDNWNGGCTAPGHPFQPLTGNEEGSLILCAVSGWYTDGDNSNRDTDWFDMIVGESGTIEVVIDAEVATYALEFAPTDCDYVNPAEFVVAEPCAQASLTLSGYSPGQLAWLWVAPTVYYSSISDNEYDYSLWVSGLEPQIATQRTDWGAVKALFE